MAIWKSQILITNSPLPEPSTGWRDSAGAVVDFWGIVRALEDGREISGIEYEAHETMAQHQMEIIAQRAQEEFDLEAVILQHRIGLVPAAEASLFLRVASGHRGAAFAASEWIVAELKKKVPIWKRPLFVNSVCGRASQQPQQPAPATE